MQPIISNTNVKNDSLSTSKSMQLLLDLISPAPLPRAVTELRTATGRLTVASLVAFGTRLGEPIGKANYGRPLFTVMLDSFIAGLSVGVNDVILDNKFPSDYLETVKRDILINSPFQTAESYLSEKDGFVQSSLLLELRGVEFSCWENLNNIIPYSGDISYCPQLFGCLKSFFLYEYNLMLEWCEEQRKLHDKRLSPLFVDEKEIGKKVSLFGKQLRKYRVDKSLTLKKMASDIGVSPTHLYHVETAIRDVTPQFLNSVVTYFGLSEQEKDKLTVLADLSNGKLVLPMSKLPLSKKKLGLLFVSQLEKMSEENVEKIRIIISSDLDEEISVKKHWRD